MAFRVSFGVGLAYRAWSNHADRCQTDGGPRGWIEQFHQALQEVVGEIQAAIVAAGSKQWRVGRLSGGEHDRSVQPRQKRVVGAGAQGHERPRFGVKIGLLGQVQVREHPRCGADRLGNRLEACGAGYGEGAEAVLVIVREEATATVPWCQDRCGSEFGQ